jgi:hypothetical protein
LFVNSVKKSVKKFLFASLILLSGCLPLPGLAPGFYAGATDVTIKSKEVLSGTECKWRCYKNKKK